AYSRTRAGGPAFGRLRRVDRVGQVVDVLAQVGAGFLDLLADLLRIAGHDMPSFPRTAPGIFFMVCAVCGTPWTALISRRPASARTAATISQMAATISADQPWPVASPIPHHAATEANSRTMWPLIPAPASSPAPLPARVADCRSSALASSTSCRMSVLRSSATSENSSPTDAPESGAVTVGSSGPLTACPGGRPGPQGPGGSPRRTQGRSPDPAHHRALAEHWQGQEGPWSPHRWPSMPMDRQPRQRAGL